MQKYINYDNKSIFSNIIYIIKLYYYRFLCKLTLRIDIKNLNNNSFFKTIKKLIEVISSIKKNRNLFI